MKPKAARGGHQSQGEILLVFLCEQGGQKQSSQGDDGNPGSARDGRKKGTGNEGHNAQTTRNPSKETP